MVDFVKIRHQNKPLLSSAQKAGIAHALGCSKTRSGTEKKSFDIYYRFNGKYLSYRQNIVRFVIYGSELVEIDTLLAQFKRNSKFCFFGGHFVISS